MKENPQEKALTLTRIYGIITPTLIAIVGFFIVRELDQINDRLTTLETLSVRVEVVEARMGFYHSSASRRRIERPNKYATLTEPIGLKESRWRTRKK